MKKHLIPLILIFLVSFVFRFFQLSQYPVHLSMDEAAISYNAFSILQTGRDEWNQPYPLAFASAGDYKPPVNVYLTVPIVKIFGLNEFSARFITALLGSLTPVVAYFLLLHLKTTLLTALFSSLWLSILPWHVHFSRAGFEAITALFFLFTGLLFFLKTLKKPSFVNLFFFITSFSLSVWAYHAERLFVPVLTLFLIFIYKNQLLKIVKLIPKKVLLINFIVLLVFLLPFLKLTFFTPAITNRASSTSILRDPSLLQSLSFSPQSLTQQIFDSNFLKIGKFWFNQYLNYFDFRFIFWKGLQFTPPNHPDLGLLYLVDLPILLFGLYRLIKNKREKLLPIFTTLFLLGPLPASLTMNPQHPLRALTWIPAFLIVYSQGIRYLFDKFNRKILFLGLLISYIIGVIFFVNIYTRLFPYFFSEYWQYGYKQASDYVCQHKDEYQQIIISDTFGSYGPLNTGLPYLYILHACQYPPEQFQQNHKTGNIDYRRVDWEHDQTHPSLLIVASPWDILNQDIPSQKIIKEIKFKNNRSAFFLIKSND